MKKELQRRDYDLVRPEFTFGNSRFDFYMEKEKLSMSGRTKSNPFL